MANRSSTLSALQPTILLGIDGATFDILDVLIAEGHMPSLKRFLEEGLRAKLLSTPHPLTPPAWTTVATGRTPGNHGIFDFIWAEERDGQAYFTLNNFRDVKAETLWATVSRLGGSVTTLNYPFLSPPPKINGALVPGLVSWKHLRRGVYPPELYDRLLSLPGFNAKEVAWDFEREKKATKTIPKEEREEWITHHIRRERHWHDMFLYLLENESSDLSAILIDGVDKLQHICWDLLDPACRPAAFDAQQERERKLCLQYFQELDGFIGKVMEFAGEDVRIFMASDHGFGPTRKVFRLNLWLEKRGYLKFPNVDVLDEREREKYDRMIQNHFIHVDWDNTVAYAQSAATNGIYIRVAAAGGRSGVKPEDYEALCDKITKQLLAERDPADGEPVVKHVLRKEEIFSGAHNERCPDLTVILHDYGFISTLNKEPVHWDRDGEVAGTHRPEGIFCARGPGIPRAASITRQDILDIAPTMMYSLGLAVPEDYEGSVMNAAFDPAYLDSHPASIGPSTLPPARELAVAPETDPEEEDIILDRLRALGYVE